MTAQGTAERKRATQKRCQQEPEVTPDPGEAGKTLGAHRPMGRAAGVGCGVGATEDMIVHIEQTHD